MSGVNKRVSRRLSGKSIPPPLPTKKAKSVVGTPTVVSAPTKQCKRKKKLVTPDSLSERAAQVKLRRQQAAGGGTKASQKCERERCGVLLSDSGGDWGDFSVVWENCEVTKTPIGNVCGPCTRTWEKAFDLTMTLEECVKRCNDETDFSDRFESALLMKPSFVKAQCTVDAEYGMYAEVLVRW